jgi:hypothetical protein
VFGAPPGGPSPLPLLCFALGESLHGVVREQEAHDTADGGAETVEREPSTVVAYSSTPQQSSWVGSPALSAPLLPLPPRLPPSCGRRGSTLRTLVPTKLPSAQGWECPGRLAPGPPLSNSEAQLWEVLGSQALRLVARSACCAAAVQEPAETGVAERRRHPPRLRDNYSIGHSFGGSG